MVAGFELAAELALEPADGALEERAAIALADVDARATSRSAGRRARSAAPAPAGRPRAARRRSRPPRAGARGTRPGARSRSRRAAARARARRATTPSGRAGCRRPRPWRRRPRRGSAASPLSAARRSPRRDVTAETENVGPGRLRPRPFSSRVSIRFCGCSLRRSDGLAERVAGQELLLRLVHLQVEGLVVRAERVGLPVDVGEDAGADDRGAVLRAVRPRAGCRGCRSRNRTCRCPCASGSCSRAASPCRRPSRTCRRRGCGRTCPAGRRRAST